MVELCILNNRMFLVARISSDCFESFSKMNWWIHCGQGLIGSFDLPWSKWSRITDPDPDHIKGTHPKTVLDSESHSMDSGFLVLDSSIFHWNMNSRFHSLMGFRIPWAVFWIPKPRISDSTRKNFTDSRIRIPLQGAIHRFAVIYARVYHARLSQRAFWN